MAEKSVFSKISNNYYSLTSSERKVADYVVVQQQKTQYMSISELAAACGVGEATISRFCRRLHYQGYNAFKLAVANSTAAHTLRSPLSGEVKPDDSIPDMCQKIYNFEVDAIAQTQDLIRPESVIQAADMMLAADKVVCMGMGGAMIMAQEAAHLFTTTFPNFFAISDSHLQTVTATQLTKRDVVLYISYSGATRDMVELLELTHRRGVPSILITRFTGSPGAKLADVVLQCGSNENPVQFGSVAARVAQLYLLDVLFSEMCRRDEAGCQVVRDKMAQALSVKHIPT